jgi:hypothetical protein
VRVGLAHVVGVSGEANRPGHPGGFVQVVGRSASVSGFRRDVRRVMDVLGFRVLALTEVATANARFAGREMPRWMCDLAHEIRPGQVGWGTFHRHPAAELPPRARRGVRER